MSLYKKRIILTIANSGVRKKVVTRKNGLIDSASVCIYVIKAKFKHSAKINAASRVNAESICITMLTFADLTNICASKRAKAIAVKTNIQKTQK